MSNSNSRQLFSRKKKKVLCTYVTEYGEGLIWHGNRSRLFDFGQLKKNKNYTPDFRHCRRAQSGCVNNCFQPCTIPVQYRYYQWPNVPYLKERAGRVLRRGGNADRPLFRRCLRRKGGVIALLFAYALLPLPLPLPLFLYLYLFLLLRGAKLRSASTPTTAHTSRNKNIERKNERTDGQPERKKKKKKEQRKKNKQKREINWIMTGGGFSEREEPAGGSANKPQQRRRTAIKIMSDCGFP